MTKVLIAAGGSGGHIFPAVALARRISQKDKDADILFVGSDKSIDRTIFMKEGFRFKLLSANKLPYKRSYKTILFFIGLGLDTLRAIFIVMFYRPSVVVGFGGYISSPVSVAAYLFRVPVVAHEQNVVPGRANRILFNLASKVAISFTETRECMKGLVSKAVYTGNPIRASIYRDDRSLGATRLGVDPKKFTILVIGGSQGARGLNDKFLQALACMDHKTIASLQVVHITGASDYVQAGEAYKALGVQNRVFSFVDEIEDAYSVADLVVTRSGASAIFELALFGKPMILVPYPFAMSHQTDNARAFSSRDAAIEIAEKDLQPEAFRDKIIHLMNNRSILSDLAKRAKTLSVPDASDRLAEVVMAEVDRTTT
jgi:UDP-N-acetylglucosamine--N-acetylmuramyl-(pentapeptide) pyrophosphoryl-undecaprenol N-acetylglucosamine transferase